MHTLNIIDDIGHILSEYGALFLHAYGVSLFIALTAYLGGTVLAIILTVARISPIGILRSFVTIYVEVFRNAPMLTLLFFLYYALPYLGVVTSELGAVIWALVLVCSAFACDNLQSGINSIPQGEIEAARSLGLSFIHIVRHIILPQALRTVISPMTTLLVMVIISSSTGALLPITHYELTGLVNSLNNTHALGIATFTVAALFYIGTGILVGWLGGKLEKKVELHR